MTKLAQFWDFCYIVQVWDRNASMKATDKGRGGGAGTAHLLLGLIAK
ncbi:MAG: hypothetical protein ACJ74Y_11225 [Bryobacteraceae bacterium]